MRQQRTRIAIRVAVKPKEIVRTRPLRVLAQINDTSKAYPFKELRKNGKTSFEDSFAGETNTIEWSDDNDHARVTDRSGKEVATVIVYWFAWYAFHPETEVFRPLPVE